MIKGDKPENVLKGSLIKNIWLKIKRTVHRGSKEIDDVEQSNNMFVIDEAPVLSDLDDTLLDIAKGLRKDSVNQSREFHKTMLGLTATFSTLMASSFGILTIGIANQPLKLDNLQKILLVIPVLLMLLSSIFFALGYYPRYKRWALLDLTDINQSLEALLKVRRQLAFLGVSSFVISITSLLGAVVFLNWRK